MQNSRVNFEQLVNKTKLNDVTQAAPLGTLLIVKDDLTSLLDKN